LGDTLPGCFPRKSGLKEWCVGELLSKAILGVPALARLLHDVVMCVCECPDFLDVASSYRKNHHSELSRKDQFPRALDLSTVSREAEIFSRIEFWQGGFNRFHDRFAAKALE